MTIESSNHGRCRHLKFALFLTGSIFIGTPLILVSVVLEKVGSGILYVSETLKSAGVWIWEQCLC